MIALALVIELLARMLQGECGPMGPQCQWLVATSVQERLQDGRFGEDLPAVLTAYYGAAPATESSRRVAYALLTGRVPSLGMPYAYSDDDVRRHGWRLGDITLHRAGLTLHMARRAPGGA
jgi:hypothetical protein